MTEGDSGAGALPPRALLSTLDAVQEGRVSRERSGGGGGEGTLSPWSQPGKRCHVGKRPWGRLCLCLLGSV